MQYELWYYVLFSPIFSTEFYGVFSEIYVSTMGILYSIVVKSPRESVIILVGQVILKMGLGPCGLFLK